jgi:hypothetical protein
MTRRRGKWAPTSPEQLDALAEVSESDKERAKDAGRRDGRNGLAELLDAEPKKPTKGRKR